MSKRAIIKCVLGLVVFLAISLSGISLTAFLLKDAELHISIPFAMLFGHWVFSIAGWADDRMAGRQQKHRSNNNA